MFTDASAETAGRSRGTNGKASLFYRPFSDMEEYMGRGGQLGSFEAVFSPRGTDGKPRQLWDRKTGEINSEVAAAWEKYDIRLVLERNWKSLGPKLAGKIHVYMGGRHLLSGGCYAAPRGVAGEPQERRGGRTPPEKDTHGSLVDAALRKHERGDGRGRKLEKAERP